MIDQEINIAIAEACGIKCEQCGGAGIRKKFGADEYAKIRAMHKEWIKRWPADEPDLPCVHELIPSYTTDLNAMHDAENILDYTQKRMLAHQIRKMHNDGEYNINPNALFKLYHATVRQRAEAFLRTIGKWREG